MPAGYKPGQRPAREDELRMMVETNAFPPITKGKPWLTALLCIAGLLFMAYAIIKAGNWFAIHFSNTSAMMFAILLCFLFFTMLFGWIKGSYWKRIGKLKTEGVMVLETVLSRDEVKIYSAKKVHMLKYPSIINGNAGRCILAACGDMEKYLPYAGDWLKARPGSYGPAS